ncbi:hypothetical protein ACIQK6_41760 [Streptomyces sp. NPDC091682]|uniref:hypothetical protein n=1 Tax=Streptomyces sp. NPDC091682 TaxID=3366005 RepID=UPI00381E271A
MRAPAEGPLSLERYATAEHLTVSRRGKLCDPIDGALTARGLERRVVVAGPTVAFALRDLDADAVQALFAPLTASQQLLTNRTGRTGRPMPVRGSGQPA